MSIVEGCAGPGGWSQALADLGETNVAGFELDADAVRTARLAGHLRFQEDVREIGTERLESWAFSAGLVFSPPCPAFSVGGLQGGQRDINRIMTILDPELDLANPLVIPREGWADAESALVMEPLRWAQAIRPGWMAFEQVPRASLVWHRMALILRRWGYATAVFTIDAHRYGVPQQRQRAILLASMDRQPRQPAYTHREFNMRKAKVDTKLPAAVSMVDALGLEPDWLVGLPRPADRHNDVDAVLIEGKWYRRRDLRRADQPSFTVTGKAKWWRVWRPEGIGYVDRPESVGYIKGEQLSVGQVAALQTFPPAYPWHGTDSSIGQQIANAVPPQLARTVLAEVLPMRGTPR